MTDMMYFQSVLCCKLWTRPTPDHDQQWTCKGQCEARGFGWRVRLGISVSLLSWYSFWCLWALHGGPRAAFFTTVYSRRSALRFLTTIQHFSNMYLRLLSLLWALWGSWQAKFP